MDLFEKVSEDIKTAMKAKDKVALDALRNVKKVFLEAKTAPGANDTLSDADALKIIQKLVKQGKDSAGMYIEQGRTDLADAEMAQVKVMEAYLPKQMTPEELERLEKLRLTGRCMKYQKTLDAFLFCCYAGMRYSDFINLSPDSIVDIHQETWLLYKSIKTGTEVRLPLYLLFGGKGLVILDKYRDNIQEFFHLRDNSNVNKDLIIISRLAGLSKKISFHTARHTNATLLIYNGVNITTVQKLLGHKSVKTTQVYTNIMDMTIVHDLEKNHSLLSPHKKM